MLIAFDDLLVRHLGESVSIPNAFDIPNGLARGLMDLPEADRLLCRNSGDEPNRDQDEGQSQIARPQRGRSHQLLELTQNGVRIWSPSEVMQGEQKQFVSVFSQGGAL